jgi:hypothetical protein
MDLILKAKHWHLFLLFIGPQMVANFSDNPIQHYVVLFSGVLNIIILSAWFWQIGVELLKNHDLDIVNFHFKVSFISTVSFLILNLFGSSITRVIHVSEIDSAWMNENWGLFFTRIYFIFCFIYCAGHCARVIKSIELKEVATLNYYFAMAIGILLFPLGVWFFQPKVNRIVSL